MSLSQKAVVLYDAAGNPILGSQVGASSIPVVIASDQAAVPTAANGQSGFTPTPHTVDTGNQQLLSDPSRQLIARSTVLSDEGSFRDDFTGSSLFTSLTGTLSFTNGLPTVTGSGTLFTTELGTDNYIRLSAHANTALAKVKQVISNTALMLETNYTGATAAGASTSTQWIVAIPASPADITVGSSLVNLLASTVNGTTVSISRIGDYLPFVMVTTCTISQRIANQTIFVGFQDVVGTPVTQAGFVFDGTVNTSAKCRSGVASDSIQETTIALPNGAITIAANVYEIEQTADRTKFIINGVQVAEHRTHIPTPYALLSKTAYIANTGTAGSATTLSVDAVFFANRNLIALDEPIAVQGVANGQPIIVQFGNPGGLTALPKIIDVTFNKSEGAVVADVYKRVATYTVPTAYNGYLIKFVTFQNETASSRFVAETNMGSHNVNTNTFTPGAGYNPPQWCPTIQAHVTTAFAVGAGNVVLTVTYTNEAGTGSRSGTITIPKGSLVDSRWDLVLQGADLGVTSIQAVTSTPTQVGVCSILGLLQLSVHQDQSTTAQTETLFAPGAVTFPTGTVLGIEYAGGLVSKLRILDALIQLVQ